MMTPKYLVCPGYVTSQNDGDTHFVGARELMELYRVNPELCVIREWGDHRAYPKELIRLAPQRSGNYDL